MDLATQSRRHCTESRSLPNSGGRALNVVVDAHHGRSFVRRKLTDLASTVVLLALVLTTVLLMFASLGSQLAPERDLGPGSTHLAHSWRDLRSRQLEEGLETHSVRSLLVAGIGLAREPRVYGCTSDAYSDSISRTATIGPASPGISRARHVSRLSAGSGRPLGISDSFRQLRQSRTRPALSRQTPLPVRLSIWRLMGALGPTERLSQ
jgi:hypothetical protein